MEQSTSGTSAVVEEEVAIAVTHLSSTVFEGLVCHVFRVRTSGLGKAARVELRRDLPGRVASSPQPRGPPYLLLEGGKAAAAAALDSALAASKLKVLFFPERDAREINAAGPSPQQRMAFDGNPRFACLVSALVPALLQEGCMLRVTLVSTAASGDVGNAKLRRVLATTPPAACPHKDAGGPTSPISAMTRLTHHQQLSGRTPRDDTPRPLEWWAQL